MKRLLIALLFTGLMCPMVVLAGGIVTNANQSAAYIRMPAQDAAISINALYYNPAGIAFLEDGFYVSINNQYISQTRTISSNFPGMNRSEFEGGVTAPFFPGVYMAYKKDKFSIALGYNPVGGGGSAIFDNGLPSFEEQVVMSKIPASLTAAGIPTTAYRLDGKFEGRSLMHGIQINGSYKVSDFFSISLGVRYIIAQNYYKGNMEIYINPNQPAFGAAYDGTNMVSAPGFFTDAATTLSGWSSGSTSTALDLSTRIGGGSITAGTLVSTLDAPTQGAIAGYLGAAGISSTGMNVGTAIGTLNAVAPVFAGKAAAMSGKAAATADKAVDAEQTGTGFAPIIGFDLKVSEKLNIGFRYEHRAKINVKNKTKLDNVGLFPDGVKTANDMPTTISMGVQYKATDKLLVSGGFHYYLDKSADYGKKVYNLPAPNDRVIDKNFLELALGFEYTLNEKFLVSAGYLRTQTGVNEQYQSDLSHSLTTNTFGGGLKYTLNEMIGINLGCMYSSYVEDSKHFTVYTDYDQTYNRSALVFAVGVDLKF